MTTTVDGLPLMGAVLHVLADAAGTGGAYEAFRLDLHPGARSPRHTLSAAKLFVVVAGEVLVAVGEEEAVRSAGTVVLVPSATPHSYRNVSGAEAAMVVVTGGEGQLAFLRGMSALAADGPVEPSAMRAHAERHGVVLLP